MATIYLFFTSLGGIIVLFGLKIWELNKGSKPFSVLRYKLDVFFHRKLEVCRSYIKFLNRRTFRLILVLVVAKIHAMVVIVRERIKRSNWWQVVIGKVTPTKNGNSAVSSFLRDVAEYKNEIIKEEGIVDGVHKNQEK